MVPPPVERISGSLPTFPSKITLFTLFAISCSPPPRSADGVPGYRFNAKATPSPAGEPVVDSPFVEFLAVSKSINGPVHRKCAPGPRGLPAAVEPAVAQPFRDPQRQQHAAERHAHQRYDQREPAAICVCP